MTPRQQLIARHCIGLGNGQTRSYRNRYFAGPAHADYDQLLEMVKSGDMIAPTGEGQPFRLTMQGAVQSVAVGETLDPEDWPYLMGTNKWLPTSENINALPEPVRKYIHDLHTMADPAGMVQTIASQEEQIKGLCRMLKEKEEALVKLEKTVLDGLSKILGTATPDPQAATEEEVELRYNPDLPRTNRGFAVYGRLKDIDGEDVRVLRSSLMEPPRAVRLFTSGFLTKNDMPVKLGPGEKITAGAHLNEEQSQALISALQKFVNGEE